VVILKATVTVHTHPAVNEEWGRKINYVEKRKKGKYLKKTTKGIYLKKRNEIRSCLAPWDTNRSGSALQLPRSHQARTEKR